jgi:hypothetical protein
MWKNIHVMTINGSNKSWAYERKRGEVWADLTMHNSRRIKLVPSK